MIDTALGAASDLSRVLPEGVRAVNLCPRPIPGSDVERRLARPSSALPPLARDRPAAAPVTDGRNLVGVVPVAALGFMVWNAWLSFRLTRPAAPASAGGCAVSTVVPSGGTVVRLWCRAPARRFPPRPLLVAHHRGVGAVDEGRGVPRASAMMPLTEIDTVRPPGATTSRPTAALLDDGVERACR
jgi:hypothetical protein